MHAAKRKDMHGCKDCGKAGPLVEDKTDSELYCSECWMTFYGYPAPLPSTANIATSSTPRKPSKVQTHAAQRSAAQQGVASCNGALPDDAPRGHRAHAHVHVRPDRIAFRFTRGTEVIDFLTTTHAASGSR